MKKRSGALVISLDFELFWGVRDHRSLSSYGNHILGARAAIPRILELFRTYEISATWATVGFLFCRSRDELIEVSPICKPQYKYSILSPYSYLNQIGLSEVDDPVHFAWSLVDMIHSCPGQEIGSHTFSHYYCLEGGQTTEAFCEDIKAALAIAQRRGISMKSLVFPRNQFSFKHLQVLRDIGLLVFRGTLDHWIYISTAEDGQHLLRRLLRLVDAYLPLSGTNSFSWDSLRDDSGLLNVRASRMLRPYTKPLKHLEPLRMRRVIRSLETAARRGEVYHLWWHPHNFGADIEANLANLEQILSAFSVCRTSFGMQSLSLAGAADYYLLTGSNLGENNGS